MKTYTINPPPDDCSPGQALAHLCALLGLPSDPPIEDEATHDVRKCRIRQSWGEGLTPRVTLTVHFERCGDVYLLAPGLAFESAPRCLAAEATIFSVHLAEAQLAQARAEAFCSGRVWAAHCFATEPEAEHDA